MTARAGALCVFGLLAAGMLALLFSLYQNPLLEIYLADWTLC